MTHRRNRSSAPGRATRAVVRAATVALLAAPLLAAAALPQPAFAHQAHNQSASARAVPSQVTAGRSVSVPTAPTVRDDGNRVWSVRPASADGKPDSRTHFTLQGTPGTAVSDQALVSNLSDAQVTFSVYGTDAFNTSTGQFDLLSAERKPTDIGAWMKFPAATITLPAKGTAVVPFIVDIPAAATPGDHAGGMVVSLITLGTGGDQNVNVDSRVAVRTYLRIPGNLRPRLAVGPVTASYAAVADPFGGGSLRVSYTVTNPGNIRLRGKQAVRVVGPFGWHLASAAPEDLTELLPGASATFTTTVDGVLRAGPITVTVELTPYPDSQQPVGQTIQPVSGSATVWAVPWVLLLLAVVLLIVGVGLWWLRRRTMLRRMDRAMVAARQGALAEAGTARQSGMDSGTERERSS